MPKARAKTKLGPKAGPAALKKMLADLPAFRLDMPRVAAGAPDVVEVVDRLGRLKALKAEIGKYEDALKDVVLATGEKEIEGRLFRAVVSGGTMGETLDIDGIRAEMSESWIKDHSIRKRSSLRVLVNARKGIEAEAKKAA